MRTAVARYREFAPCEGLQSQIRAFFSFAPDGENDLGSERRIMREVRFRRGDSFCSPLFADGHISLVVSFQRACYPDGSWRLLSTQPRADVIGAMTTVGSASLGERAEMIGVYFRGAPMLGLVPVPADELTDRVVSLSELWRRTGSEWILRLWEASSELARVDCLEALLLKRCQAVERAEPAIDVPALARWILRERGRITVQTLAEAAGVSRQHLTRVFRERVGVTPKTYCRLARFHAGLGYAGCGPNMDWAQVAPELGYADQSHMIAEFRMFSSLTPGTLSSGRWFHPFIERARNGHRRA
jgi:AraC-like DNA-binding protein